MRTARLLPVSTSMHCSRGRCTWPQGGCTWSWGVYLVPGIGGVPGPEGTWSWGVYLVPGGCTWTQGVPGPRGCTWSRGVPAQALPLWTEWQTGAKILPCPKLRLRVVKIGTITPNQSLLSDGTLQRRMKHFIFLFHDVHRFKIASVWTKEYISTKHLFNNSKPMNIDKPNT